LEDTGDEKGGKEKPLAQRLHLPKIEKERKEARSGLIWLCSSEAFLFFLPSFLFSALWFGFSFVFDLLLFLASPTRVFWLGSFELPDWRNGVGRGVFAFFIVCSQPSVQSSVFLSCSG
jgi:hypothetical protein